MRKVLLGLAVIVAIAGVAAFASPLLGLQALRDAFAGRDAGALAPLVDTGRLQAALALRAHARYAQPGAPSADESRLAQQAGTLATPQGLIAAVCDGGRPAAAGAPCPVEGALGNVRFASPNRYSAALTENDRVVATVVMDRVGFRWQLVDLVLPPSVYDDLTIPASN